MTFTLDESQLAAVELVLGAPVGIVTGGPGTGKTTTLRTALDHLDAEAEPCCPRCAGRGWVDAADHHGRLDSGTCDRCDGSGVLPRYLLAAPTGKAARRMEEATGRTASTVHRLLEFGPLPAGGMGFRRHAGRPLGTTLVVIDESSMLDTELAACLFAAIDPGTTRLVLVGDANQLPSVGPGRVLCDLIDSGRVPVARLTTLHRAAAESWVCTQAPEILAGRVPDLRSRDDFRWHAQEVRDHALHDVVESAEFMRAQVLVAQNVGPAGADRINALLQERLNPHGARAWKVRDTELRIGDAVIHTRNDYTLGVMNGETGRVVRAFDEALVVDFGEACTRCDGIGRIEPCGFMPPETPSPPCDVCGGTGGKRLVEYSRDQALSLRLAYALTVHKSQGSEWPWVVVLCHSTHARMLTRQLFYTAITRAKQGVVLVGDRKGLEYAVKQTRDADRLTALKERIDAEARRAGVG